MSRAPYNHLQRLLVRNWIFLGLFLLLGRLTVFADQSVMLTWDPSPDTNVVGYNLFYGGASGDYTNTVFVSSAASVTISGLSEGATYYFAATTVSASGAQSAFSNEAIFTMPQANTNSPVTTNTTANVNLPPTLDSIANLTIYQNAGVQTVNLTGISAGSSNGTPSLVVSVVSSDPTIIPIPTVIYTSPNGTGSLTFTAVANALGTATLTVTVDNGSVSNNLVSQAFNVSVLPVPVVTPPPPPPTLNAITNLTIYQNAGVQTVNLTGLSAGSTNGKPTLVVAAVSSNSSIIPTLMIDYTSPNSAGTLTFAPATNALGTAILTVTVDNGGVSNNLVSQSFSVSVVPVPVVIPPPSLSPTLEPIANLTLLEGASPQTVILAGIGPSSSTAKSVLRISATSSNPRLIPAPLIRYPSSSQPAQLTLRPSPFETGTTTITVTLINAAASNGVVRQAFTVAVLPIPPPTLDPIANVSVAQGAGIQTLALTGITSGISATHPTLRVTVSSSNPRIVRKPAIQYTSPANTAWLTFSPSETMIGVATVTVMVTDDDLRKDYFLRRFKVTVTPPAHSLPVVASGFTPKAIISTGTNVEATLTSVAKTNGQFSFQVTGLPGSQYVVQETSDMLHWTSVQTNHAPFTFQASTTDGVSQRFYRAYYLP